MSPSYCTMGDRLESKQGSSEGGPAAAPRASKETDVIEEEGNASINEIISKCGDREIKTVVLLVGA